MFTSDIGQHAAYQESHPILFAARAQDTRYREGLLWETLVRICENLGW